VKQTRKLAEEKIQDCLNKSDCLLVRFRNFQLYTLYVLIVLFGSTHSFSAMSSNLLPTIRMHIIIVPYKSDIVIPIIQKRTTICFPPVVCHVLFIALQLFQNGLQLFSHAFQRQLETCIKEELLDITPHADARQTYYFYLRLRR